MKKKILAGVLAVASAFSVFAFPACTGNEGNNGDGLDKDTVETIIKDEATWNKAFENVDYANFSMRVKIKYTGMDEAHINYCEVTPNAVYLNLENKSAFYSLKQENETCKTYVKGYDSYANKYYSQSHFTILNDTSDKYLTGGKTVTVLKVSYADYFDLFTYDEESTAYTYDGVIETTSYNFDGSQSQNVNCTNIVIRVENNRIVYISSDYTLEDFQEGDEASFEYFDIGSTVVEVPEEVIANAVQEEKLN